MDQDRQIRFAIPPFFLFASLLWGAYLSHQNLCSIFKPETAKEVLGLLAATAVVVVPLGYLISTISVNILRLIALIARTTNYEAVLTDATFDRIWAQTRTGQVKHKSLTLYAVATFDHELLSTGVHMWLFRRWTSFNIAVHSIVALALALFVAPCFSIPRVCAWWLSTIVVVGFLSLMAWTAWAEVMGMLEFQSHRHQGREAKAE
jgi:hypothetical protein